MTEFQPKDQPGASASAASAKKKGRQNRRTKRGDLDAVLDDAANKVFPSNAHDPSPEKSKVGTSETMAMSRSIAGI